MKRRIFLYVLLGLLAAGVLYLGARWGLKEYALRPVGGRLSYDASALPSQEFTVGSGGFSVAWDNVSGRLAVRHAGQGQRELWGTLSGKSFVAAAEARAAVEESRGSFFFSDQRERTCASQSITAFEQQDGALAVLGSLECGGGQSSAYTLTFSQASPNQLQFRVELEDAALNRIYLTYEPEPAHFFGFGEQFTYFDLKGKRVPVFISEQGIGRGEQPITLGADLQARAGGSWSTSYASLPFYITSDIKSLFLENYEYSVFDLRRSTQVQVQVWAPEMTGRILAGSSPAELISEYTLYAGRMRPLPDWILSGAVVGMQGGTARVREVWQELKQRGTPLAAFWLQDWVGQRTTSFGKQLWWNWTLDPERYPGWSELTADLEQEGIKVMTYISPFLADASQKPGLTRNLFKEAEAAGYLVKGSDGQTLMIQNTDFAAGLVDLTNPEAREWMKQVIREELIGAGASGWMADFGEALPWDAVLSDGQSGAEFHNAYPEAWAQVNREAVEESSLGDEAVFFMRSAFRRSPAYASLFWEGDQLVSWDANDGIKSAVTGLLSGGISGFAYNHSDIGGYTAITNPIMNYHRSKELLLRWMELSAFTTVYRTHEGNRPAENAQFYDDEDSLAAFDRSARIYTAWEFYRRQLVDEAAQSGLPVARHLFIHYPDDPETYKLRYEEYLLGTELLVAPVLDPKVDEVSVYLPKGRWVHVWSGQVYGSAEQGTRVTVAAPLGQPAVFYPQGSQVGQMFVQNLTKAGLLK